MLRARRGLVLIVVLLFAGTFALAQGEWDWLPFTRASSPELVALHGELHRIRINPGTLGYPVKNARFASAGFEVRMGAGTLWVEAPIEGYPAGAWFEGEAYISFEPGSRVAEDELLDQWGISPLHEIPVPWVYLFTLRGVPIVEQIKLASEASKEWAVSRDYARAKRALRMTGLRLLHSFLNRDGRCKGSVFAVFAPEDMRKVSPDGHLLYAYDPDDESEIQLSIFGSKHAIQNPYATQALSRDDDFRYRWWPVTRAAAAPPVFAPHGRVKQYTSRVAVAKAGKSAEVETLIDFTPNSGLSALAFALSPRLEIESIATGDGAALPFAQWAYVPEQRTRDASVVVRLPEPAPAGVQTSVRVKTAGPLFDAFLGGMVQTQEDLWKPTLDDPEGSLLDLECSVPKNMRVASAGVLVSETVQGSERLYHYRTTRPVNIPSFYVGPFELSSTKAGDVAVELLHAPARDEIQSALGVTVSTGDNPDFALEEIANALRFYSKLLDAPLATKTLRVATTPTGHGRGFEGLLLLSKYAGLRSDSSGADLFRAHEVAHQWWGGMVLSKRWPEDRWLTESFAEFMAMEYYEARFQDPKKTEQRIKDQWVNALIMQTPVRVTTIPGGTAEIRTEENSLVRGGQNVYTKGPLVLRHLRYVFVAQRKGEEAFWSLLSEFLKANAYKPVSTQDFINATEAKLGGKIPWFWDQWVYGSGIPRVRFRQTLEPHPDGGFVLTVTATQEGSHFTLPLPVRVYMPGGRVLTTHLAFRGKEATMQTRLVEKPKKVTLNEDWQAPVEVLD